MTDDSHYINIFESLDKHTTIITPNRRLSATLHKLYQQYQINADTPCWSTPDILPVSSWIQRFWKEAISLSFDPTPLLLTTTQEQFIWEKIIVAAKDSEQLLQVSETADIARSAWGLLKQWDIDINHPAFIGGEDATALHQWATHFEVHCEEEQWLDMARLPTLLAAKVASGEIALPQRIITIGFTELTPQLKNFLLHCEQAGCHLSHIAHLSPPLQNEAKRISLTDSEKEIQIMARFAKATLEKHPEASIGCVIPSLEMVRDRVMQVFTEVFTADKRYLFNISAGKKLVQYPIINLALHLLSLHKKTVSIEVVSYLLASPFLGEADVERIKRGMLDSALRQANINSLDISNMPLLATHCPHLARRLRKFFALLDENKTSLTYTGWAHVFTQLLTTLGWPGERSLNSEEYQIVESWLSLLAEYTSLDQVAKPAPIKQALHTLQKMAANAVFQPKSPEAPIQVLGVLEAAGLPFDYLWVAGMDDLSWPPQPKPNPFIPKRLQREFNMPHATAERELMFCQLLIQQYKQSAGQLIFSHAEKNDALELQASPLIRHLPNLTIHDLHLPPYQSLSERIYQSKQMESLMDDRAPALLPNEKVRGGVNVIKQQALCPFKAFSEWRLHAHALESPRPGLRAKDRGNIIHKILELIWEQLHNHATLVALDKLELDKLIASSISTALTSPSHTRDEYKEYLSLEEQRLHKLIGDWLQIEMQRPPFKVITNEKATEITISRLTLSIRIDRVDELDDGKKLIIDYKTGKNNELNSWFSDRPEEPQLPLYSQMDTDNIVGITFAQVASGEHCFKGTSRYSLDIKGIKLLPDIKKTTATSWHEQVAQWGSTLAKLSDDFYHGIAKVDPKEEGATCLWCSLKPLCRINEEPIK